MVSQEPEVETVELVCVRIGVGRPVIQLVVFAVFAALIFAKPLRDPSADASGAGSVASERGATLTQEHPVVTFGLAILFGGGLLTAAIIDLVRNTGRYLRIDEQGLTYVRRRGHSLLAWPDIAGVGCVLVETPWWTWFSLYRPQRDLHVELYLRQMTRARHRHLAELWGAEEDAAHPHMPRIRLRFGEVAPVAMEEFANAVREHDARRWLGLRQ